MIQFQVIQFQVIQFQVSHFHVIHFQYTTVILPSFKSIQPALQPLPLNRIIVILRDSLFRSG